MFRIGAEPISYLPSTRRVSAVGHVVLNTLSNIDPNVTTIRSILNLHVLDDSGATCTSPVEQKVLDKAPVTRLEGLPFGMIDKSRISFESLVEFANLLDGDVSLALWIERCGLGECCETLEAIEGRARIKGHHEGFEFGFISRVVLRKKSRVLGGIPNHPSRVLCEGRGKDKQSGEDF